MFHVNQSAGGHDHHLFTSGGKRWFLARAAAAAMVRNVCNQLTPSPVSKIDAGSKTNYLRTLFLFAQTFVAQLNLIEEEVPLWTGNPKHAFLIDQDSIWKLLVGHPWSLLGLDKSECEYQAGLIQIKHHGANHDKQGSILLQRDFQICPRTCNWHWGGIWQTHSNA